MAEATSPKSIDQLFEEVQSRAIALLQPGNSYNSEAAKVCAILALALAVYRLKDTEK